MRRGTCATCAFFVDAKGECRLNPPTPIVIAFQRDNTTYGVTHVKSESRWPSVDSDDWCSHFRDAIIGGRRKTWNHQLNDGDA